MDNCVDSVMSGAGAKGKGLGIGRERIDATAELIRGHVRRTPVIEVAATDFGLEAL